MLRKYLSLLLSVLMLLSATSAFADLPTPGASTGSTSSGNAVSTWPMTITDYEGRTVTIKSEPKRIMTMAPSATEIIWELGLGARHVGRSTYCDYPAQVSSVPSIGDLWNPNFEKMVDQQPDLVLAIGGSKKMWEKLDELGIPVVVLQPANFYQVYESIELVGKITGTLAKAQSVTSDMKERVSFIKSRISWISDGWKPRVFYEVWHDPLMSAGPGSFIDDMIKIAGGENIASDAKSAWPTVSKETMIARDPYRILTTDAAWARRVGRGEEPGWDATFAGYWGHIYVLDGNLVSRPGPRLVQGLEQIANALHPLLFFYDYWY